MTDPAKLIKAQSETMEVHRRFSLLSHDIRTALGGVWGNLARVNEDGLDPETAECIKGARASARLLHQFLKDVEQNFEDKREATASPLILAEHKTDELLGDIAAQWRPLARSEGLSLEISRSDAVPDLLKIDEYRLSRVIGNILENAIKYAPSGAIEMNLDCPTKDALEITIRDHGPGFSEDALVLLFSYLGRPESAAQLGSGYGLFIARTLTEEMAGKIAAQNALDGGAQVTITLPLSPNAEFASSQLKSDVTILPNATLPKLTGYRILLAEDNMTNQVVVSQMLEAMGAEFAVASDGLDALALIEARPFDLALIDIEMPRLSGLELIGKVRALGDARASMPLVAFTAYALREHREKINAAGADGLIAKPVISIEDLGNAILRHLPAGNSASPTGPDQTQVADASTAAKPEIETVVDLEIYNRLETTIGFDNMQELLRRVREDLTGVREQIDQGLEAGTTKPGQQASHVLISVAGAIGATQLQQSAQRLNTQCNGGNMDQVKVTSSECLGGIDMLMEFVRSRTHAV